MYILRPLLGTSEHIKGGLLDWYAHGILLGAEPGSCDGYLLGSDDDLSLEPWQYLIKIYVGYI